MIRFYWIALFSSLMFVPQIVKAAEVPEEARRHLMRGQAFVEMAKRPEDYAKAITEFKKAARLAPQWPDVYLYLGAVQEQAKQYGDAIKSYQQFLSLAPNSPEARKVRNLLYKLEAKAEQAGRVEAMWRELTDRRGLRNTWHFKNHCHSYFPEYFIRNGMQTSAVVNTSFTGQRATVPVTADGNRLSYKFVFLSCDIDGRAVDCPEEVSSTVDIVSANRLRVHITSVTLPGRGIMDDKDRPRGRESTICSQEFVKR